RGILLLKQYDVLAEECDASLCRFKERTLAAWESHVILITASLASIARGAHALVPDDAGGG
ncbi:hypothetical protein CTI14_50420, partial [Methylobacterium radiotolerans]